MKMKVFLLFVLVIRVAYGDNQTVCFENLNCYAQEEPFVTPQRPLPYPENPQMINVEFYLLTRATGVFQEKPLLYDSNCSPISIQETRHAFHIDNFDDTDAKVGTKMPFLNVAKLQGQNLKIKCKALHVPEIVNFVKEKNNVVSNRSGKNRIILNPDYSPNLTSLYANDYQPRRQVTAFIIHGFLASIESKWMVDMALAYLSRSDANIFLVGWGEGADNLNYLQSVANIRVVEDIVARFIKTLIDKTYLQPLQVHCLGHSLGAHICGVAGKRFRGIYRCTGLDPASPAFEGHSREVRMSDTDCLFVDILHTNGKPLFPLGLGYIQPHGQVDFFFNGGHHQPQCILPKLPDNIEELNLLTLPTEVLSSYASCSHSLSIDYMIEAIGHTECVMWGHKKSSLDIALDVVTEGTTERMIGPAECSLATCSPVGLETFLFPARGSFYVTTNLKSSYCRGEPDNTILMKSFLRQYYNYRSLLGT